MFEISSARARRCAFFGGFVGLGVAMAVGCGTAAPSSAGPGNVEEGGVEHPEASVAVDEGGTTDAGPDSAVPVPKSCAAEVCSGRGVCTTATTCACDEGFDAPNCANKNADYGRRVKIAEGLADPDVLKIDDDHWVLSGTGSGHDLEFLESTDLTTWTPGKTYDPSSLDPKSDYCWIWAPGWARDGDKVVLYFSALLNTKGTACPDIANSPNDVATFRATAPDTNLEFGPPERLFPGTTGPRTYTPKGCPEQCGDAIRIDASVYQDRLYFVYFAGGNNVTSIALADASNQLFHTGPDIAGWAGHGADEGTVNEGPYVYPHDGSLYLFFSTGDFRGPYTTRYIKGETPADLTRSNGTVLSLDTPAYDSNGHLVETHGHNAVNSRRGETFNFFHVGVFDGSGKLVRRDVYRQRIAWNDDGTAINQNAVSLSWDSVGGGYTYSLDFVLRDGSTIPACMNSGRLGSATSAKYVGVCPDAGNRLTHKSSIQTLRIYASNGGGFVKVGEAPYDGYSDHFHISTTAP